MDKRQKKSKDIYSIGHLNWKKENGSNVCMKLYNHEPLMQQITQRKDGHHKCLKFKPEIMLNFLFFLQNST